jgi:hypothetical protein
MLPSVIGSPGGFFDARVMAGTWCPDRRYAFALSSKGVIMPREIVEPHKGDKRYVRRGSKGRFKKEVDVGRSLSADRRSKAKTVVKKGEGDRGDQRRPKS